MPPKDEEKYMKMNRIALVGNPNCGKTTLFNALTGAHQTIGNWPGVTVEIIEGDYTWVNNTYHVTDLPGIYSITPRSPDERVTRDFLQNEAIDLIINIADASNLNRNLYLTVQLLELGLPVLLVLNMMDIAEQHKIHIDIPHLTKHLGCPIIPIVASRKEGLEELKKSITQVIEEPSIVPLVIPYDEVVETAICKLESILADSSVSNLTTLRNRILENLEIKTTPHEATLSVFETELLKQKEMIRHHTKQETDIMVADGRYGFINGLLREVITQDEPFGWTFSDAIDRIMLNRYLGVPFFFFVMFLMFTLTMKVGQPFVDFINRAFGILLDDGLTVLLQNWQAPLWLITLLAHGVGIGIQTVATFVPPIFIIFLCLSFLEDSGYMARAAFIMDRYMRAIGLPGKAFIPMLVGFGCTVPAILATRTLENKRDRVLTILMNPFMSCGARLPVYTFFTAIFFLKNANLVVFGLYMIGILLAVASGIIFQKTILRSKPTDFVMELPPYHIPTINGVFMHTWHRLKDFILRAGHTILLVIVFMSFLNAFKIDGSFDLHPSSQSVLSVGGRIITPVFHPMGINNENWPATVGLITGVFNKESVIGTLQALYPFENNQANITLTMKEKWIAALRTIPEDFHIIWKHHQKAVVSPPLQKAIYDHFPNRNAAFAYLLFILIYSPCVASLTAMKKEIGTGWTLFSFSYMTVLAWIVATLFYQFSMIAVQPVISLIWIAIACLVLVSVYLLLRSWGRSKNSKFGVN
jgi:ferrous iron transport protein B